jgi:hypothetical protein
MRLNEELVVDDYIDANGGLIINGIVVVDKQGNFTANLAPPTSAAFDFLVPGSLVVNQRARVNTIDVDYLGVTSNASIQNLNAQTLTVNGQAITSSGPEVQQLVVGTSSAQTAAVDVTFESNYSAAPVVMCTVSAGSTPGVYAGTVSSVTSTGCTVTVCRVDAATGWTDAEVSVNVLVYAQG